MAPKSVVTNAFLAGAISTFGFTDGCTIIAVGKDASSSGYAMVGHTDDAGYDTTDVRLTRVTRKDWPAGSKRGLFRWNDGYPRIVRRDLGPDYDPVGAQTESPPLREIPQVSKTWAYWDTDYGVQNEKGLSIGESTCAAKTVGWPADLLYGYNNAGIEDLSKIALERCETARCAVKTMGDIAVEHGFYSADSGDPNNPGYSDSAEALVVVDAIPGEMWIFNVLTGKSNASAIWAAQRIASDHVTVVANSLSIKKMNLSDSDNFMYSEGITQLAEEMGWWHPDEEESPEMFSFLKAYGWPALGQNVSVDDKNVAAFYPSRRIWRVFSLLSPTEGSKLDPYKGFLPYDEDIYPTSVPAPKGSVTLELVLNTFRDHFEGTPFDLTKGMAAGPHGNPNRGVPPRNVSGMWERALSMHRTTYSFVNVVRPHGRGVVWFGLDSPHGTVYLPFFAGASESAPPSYRSHEGYQSKFSTKVAWWAYNLINQYADLNFQAINGDVRKRAQVLETKAISEAALWDQEADRMTAEDPQGHSKALKMLTARSNALAEDVTAKWWDFSGELFAKYGRYVVTYNESDVGSVVTGQVLPEWWVRSPEVGYSTWRPQGPFNGIVIDAANYSEMKTNADNWNDSVGVVGNLHLTATELFLLWTLSTLLIAGSAYQLGQTRGSDKLNAADYYFRHP